MHFEKQKWEIKSLYLQQDLEGTLHHIQIDNARLDAELKHERQRVEQLQKDLQDSQKVNDLVTNFIIFQ